MATSGWLAPIFVCDKIGTGGDEDPHPEDDAAFSQCGHKRLKPFVALDVVTLVRRRPFMRSITRAARPQAGWLYWHCPAAALIPSPLSRYWSSSRSWPPPLLASAVVGCSCRYSCWWPGSRPRRLSRFPPLPLAAGQSPTTSPTLGGVSSPTHSFLPSLFYTNL